MEGALTVHFPPNKSVYTYVQGAQFSTLNAIRDGMAYGHLSTTHPSILGLKLLDSSYSLKPYITPELEEAIVQERDKKNANIAAAVLIPLFILCCCGCCFFLWKRRPNDVDDLHDMVDDMFLPFVKSKMKSLDDRDVDSLYNPVKPHAKQHKKSMRRGRQGKSRRSANNAQADAFSRQLAESVNASKGGGGDDDDDDDDEGLESSARRRSGKKSKTKKKKKKKKHRKEKKSKRRSKKRKEDEVNMDSTDTDNTDTDDNTNGRGTSSSSTDDNNSTTSGSSRSSTTSSDRGSTTEGTSDDDKETTSTSTSDDDRDTTTSTSTSDGDKTSSSGDESEADDDFDVNSMASSRSNFMLQRRNLRRRSKGRNLGPTTRSKPKLNTKNNLVIAGTVDDDASVMTGVTGMHSMASAATAQAKNVVSASRIGASTAFGIGNASPMMGMSAVTNRLANAGVGVGVGSADEVGFMPNTLAETGEIRPRPPSPTSFSYIPKSSLGSNDHD